MPKIIERLFCPVNEKIIVKLILKSLDNLNSQFFSESSKYHDKMNAQCEIESFKTQVQNMSFCHLLATFFALLNVDMDMKEYILFIDNDANARKNTRFFVDLHDTLVSAYFNRKASTQSFVEVCEETCALA